MHFFFERKKEYFKNYKHKYRILKSKTLGKKKTLILLPNWEWWLSGGRGWRTATLGWGRACEDRERVSARAAWWPVFRHRRRLLHRTNPRWSSSTPCCCSSSTHPPPLQPVRPPSYCMNSINGVLEFGVRVETRVLDFRFLFIYLFIQIIYNKTYLYIL